MSFKSTQSTLTIGDNNSSTVNINDASLSTLNLGNATTSTNINTIKMPYSSSPFANCPDGPPDPAFSAVNGFYKLPYSSTQYLLFQWGFVPAPSNTISIVEFVLTYNTIPFVYATRFSDSDSAASLGIYTDNSVKVTTLGFQVNSAINNNNKASINWFAIGLKNY